MKIVGMLRVKNESRWIERCVKSLVFCDAVVLFDDHSTDDTARIAQCARPDIIVVPSPFHGLAEARDKNYLLDHARDLSPDWIVHLDGDEALTPGVARFLHDHEPDVDLVECRFSYLWDSEDQVRTDGVYGKFFATRLFRYRPNCCFTSINRSEFHCGSYPSKGYGCARRMRCEEPILHYGYFDAQLRAHKFAFYNEHDPGNASEDYYRHVTQGDPGGVPADWRQGIELRHAGPLRLESIA